MKKVSTKSIKNKVSDLIRKSPADRKNVLNTETGAIPELKLEQYETTLTQSPAESLQAQGSIRYAWIGVGRCGARLAGAFYELGYKKTLAVDTDGEDLGLLELPEHLKFRMDAGTNSNETTDNTKIDYISLQANQQQILHLARQTFGTGIDHIMLCLGAGGETSTGSIFGLIEVAKRYARYIGLDRPNKNVGVVMTLPARNIGANPAAIANAYKVATKLYQMASADKLSPLIIIDNNCINKMCLKSPKGSLWSGINEGFAELFDTFNLLSSRSSPYTSFDPIEYRSIIQAGGCSVMGMTEIQKLDDPFAISEAVKSNFDKTVFAGGLDLTTAKQAGCIVVGDKALLGNIRGLQNNIDYAFDVLSEMTANATMYRGIYEDNCNSLKVYTIIGGMEPPHAQLQKLKSKEYYRPCVGELEGLPLYERKEDIIPLAEYFLANQAQKFNEPHKTLSPDTKKFLIYYIWPGDIHELAAAMERAYILTEAKQIECPALPAEIIFADYKGEQVTNWDHLDKIRCEIINRAFELTADKNSAAQILGISTELVEWYVENMNISPTRQKSSNKKRALIPS